MDRFTHAGAQPASESGRDAFALGLASSALGALVAAALTQCPNSNRSALADTGTTRAPEMSAFWPHVRGPTFDGNADATELVDSFGAEGPPVLWTRPLGVGYSGLVCDDRRVYTQYQTWGGQYLVCLDALSGRDIWTYRYDGPYDPAGLYPGPRATPTLALGNVFFAAPSGKVGCVDAVTGQTRWTMDVFEQFGVQPVEFGYSCSPTVIGDVVLLPVGSPQASMVALDANSGRTVWHTGDDPISHVPALPITWQGQQLVLGYLRNALVAYRIADGSVAWRLPLSRDYDEHAAWPIYREPYLWISAPFRSGSQLLELTDEPPGYRSVWKSKLLSNDVASSVLVGEHLYGFDIRDIQSKLQRPSRGHFRCLELLDGRECWANGAIERVEWNPDSESAKSPERIESTSIGQASVLYADGKLVMFNDTGELILARADPQEYRELGRVRILGGEICWTPPALAHGRLYARNHSRAVCVLLGNSAAAESERSTLTAADIPQTAYRDWSAVILAVEPRYAMDLPSRDLLWIWYKVSLVELCAAALLAAAVAGSSRHLPRTRRRSSKANELPTVTEVTADPVGRGGLYWPLFLFFAFVAGALSTTLVSRWLGQFVFTWPLCLFTFFHAVVDRAGPRSGGTAARRWADRILLFAFLTVCWAYYLICRRLGLAFEWVFLAGFFAAVPFLVVARRSSAASWRARFAQAMLIVTAFTAYYWMSVAVLAWRYRS